MSRLISEWVSADTLDAEEEESMILAPRQTSTNSAIPAEELKSNSNAPMVPFYCELFTTFIRKVLKDYLLTGSQTTEIYSTLLEVVGLLSQNQAH